MASRGHEARHVLEVGLETASDAEIWNYAARGDFILVTKDEDFPQRASQPRSTVQVVWVRLGNCRTKALLASFDFLWKQVVAALEAGNRVVEIR